jgi:hypothetical protein
LYASGPLWQVHISVGRGRGHPLWRLRSSSGFRLITYLICFHQSCSIADRHTTLHKCLLKSHFSGLVSLIEWLLKIILKRKKPSPHKQVTWLFTYFSNKLNCYSPGPNKGAYTMLKLLLALPQGGRDYGMVTTSFCLFDTLFKFQLINSKHQILKSAIVMNNSQNWR